MPIVFVHGIGNRRSQPAYSRRLAAMDALLSRLVRPVLKLPEGRNIDAYWGDQVPELAWGGRSIPGVHFLEHFGNSERSEREDDALARFIATPPPPTGPSATSIEAFGATASPLRRAALAGPARFLEMVMAPFLHGDETPVSEESGTSGADLMEAVYLAGVSEGARAIVAAPTSDEEMLDALEGLVRDRLRPASPPGAEAVERYGPSWVGAVGDRIGEFFERAKSAPGRAVSLGAFDLCREGITRRSLLPIGDLLHYLANRGTAGAPGAIVMAVLAALRSTPRDEPLLVITHSMGGNILYDILAHFDPSLRHLVRAWVSVGGQVAMFEEMKVFRSSDVSVREKPLPSPVTNWVNFYDPADVLGLAASPLFEAVEDRVYSTGSSALDAHGAYFFRPSFFHELAGWLRTKDVARG